jgi:hypothetical protein
MKKKHPETSLIKKIVTAIVLIAVGILAYYSIGEYNKQKAAEGIVICNTETNECLKTLHIHSDITIDVCGYEVKLPREIGALNGLHTHKEKNYLHFHDKLPLEQTSKEQLFDKRLSLQEVLDTFTINPAEHCTGSTPIVTDVTVNGTTPSDGLQYNWTDGDQISLIIHQ